MQTKNTTQHNMCKTVLQQYNTNAITLPNNAKKYDPASNFYHAMLCQCGTCYGLCVCLSSHPSQASVQFKRL